MTVRPQRPVSLIVVLVALLLGDCGARDSGPDMVHERSCGQQADREFARQNRYLMSEQDQSTTPFSSSGTMGDTTKGLDDQYRRDRMVDDCLHSAAPSL